MLGFIVLISEMGFTVVFNQRRHSLAVSVDHIKIGGDAPIVVQSMTDTDTANVQATVAQSVELANAGSEIIRVTVNTPEAAAAVPRIRESLDALGIPVPIVGDFHYNGHQLLKDFPDCAQALSKYRINPGNVGFGHKKDAQFSAIIEQALIYDKPVRIGVNWGSLDKRLLSELMDKNAQLSRPRSSRIVMREALVESVLRSAADAVALGMPKDKIVLSCKVSVVEDLVAVYTDLAGQCDYPLHLGLTEAGMGDKAVVASSVAMGLLLGRGIGDTIRTSLTPEPGMPRVREVQISQQILQSMGLRSFTPSVTSCPGCGRTTSVFFRELTQSVTAFLQKKMVLWRKSHAGVESMTVAVMGCVVNGPGESKHANIGISLPGTGEVPVAPVFIDGEKRYTLRGDAITEEFLNIIESYVQQQYS